MIETVSKNNLSDWYKRTAVQHIRPVDLNELTSKRFWEKWNRVDKDALKQIAYNFFQRMWQAESPDADYLLFDTTKLLYFHGQSHGIGNRLPGQKQIGQASSQTDWT